MDSRPNRVSAPAAYAVDCACVSPISAARRPIRYLDATHLRYTYATRNKDTYGCRSPRITIAPARI